MATAIETAMTIGIPENRKRTASVVIMTLAFLLSPVRLYAATPPEKLLARNDAWFASQEGQRIMSNILDWQTSNGDWPKNVDTTSPITGESQKEPGTFDNGATTGELRLVARAFRATKDPRYLKSFTRGFDLILKAQYSNGGWPQYYPPSKSYHRHVTFNDGSMVRLLQFLRDVSALEEYAFLDAERRDKAARAVDSGIACILKCQIIENGIKTVWCAQHDVKTLLPAQGRSFEHPSLSGSESAGILLFLMSLDHPSPEVINAVDAGVDWFSQAKISGYRYHKSETGTVLETDPNATPLWARFYELGSHKPIFSDRDGLVKYQLEEIGAERRNGYAWYGNWGQKVENAYAKWPYRKPN